MKKFYEIGTEVFGKVYDVADELNEDDIDEILF